MTTKREWLAFIGRELIRDRYGKMWEPHETIPVERLAPIFPEERILRIRNGELSQKSPWWLYSKKHHVYMYQPPERHGEIHRYWDQLKVKDSYRSRG